MGFSDWAYSPNLTGTTDASRTFRPLPAQLVTILNPASLKTVSLFASSFVEKIKETLFMKIRPSSLSASYLIDFQSVLT